MPFIVSFLGWAFSIGTLMLLIGFTGVSWYIYKLSSELPDYQGLKNYDPAIMSRVHANDGQLLAEYARERRIYVPANVMPRQLINAFISAEDKNFFEHKGVDPEGIIKAIIRNLKNTGKRAGGASTITQQVAKNFLLSSERTLDRKIKEAILAIRIERALDKEHILELYLNQIFLGLRAYGVAAAALNYFDKSLDELEIHQIAYLAALPKAPNNYHPFRRTRAAIARRNWVLDRMVINGFLDREEAERAKKKPLDVNPRPLGAHLFAAEFFAEEVRRKLVEKFGEEQVYTGGLSVRTTLEPKLQRMARKALVKGLVGYDRTTGWRGPLARVDTSGDWGAALARIAMPNDIAPWRMAVVLDVSKTRARIGLRPPQLKSGRFSDARDIGIVLYEDMKWARPFLKRVGKRNLLGKRPKAVSDTLAVGDVIYVAPAAEDYGQKKSKKRKPPKLSAEEKALERWQLVQIPQVGGAIVVMDPHTGRVLALVGGFSFAHSQFNRATQAARQPGSSFKPFVYATALDNGYTPATVVVDAPIVIDQGPGLPPWKPENYSTRFYGPSTLRIGIEKSRNLMTVRLAQNLGMAYISEYAKRFGVYDNLKPVLSMSLGAGETTLLRLATGYCMLANGGKKVEATLIDRIQNRRGETIYRHDKRICRGCEATEWRNQPDPVIEDVREQVIDPQTSYQITSMMEGVVQRGTATAVRAVGKPLAGKTGTTNDYKDAWFIGFSPDLVAGVFVGYDTPTPMGKRATGGGLAAPIFRDFMKMALADKPAIPFRVPPGIRLISINSKTGLRAPPGSKSAILEAFKSNDEMPRDYDPVLEQYQQPVEQSGGSDVFGGWEVQENRNAPSGFGDVY